MNPLPIRTKLAVQPMQIGDGFRALSVRGDDATLDPFLMVDHYWMSRPTFGAHPHAGFSAVTYMFDDAQTGFRNRDSRGDDSIIAPGDLHWTTAGAGVVHDEVPIEEGRIAHGLQIFVNLTAADKHMAPGSIHVPAARMPVIEQAGGARVKLVFGPYDDGQRRVAPLAAFPTPAALLDVQAAPGAAFAYPVPVGINAFVLVIGGAVRIDGRTVRAGQAVAFGDAGGELRAEAEAHSQFAVFLGSPLREPVYRQGPFAMAHPDDLQRAAADFRAGRMGRL